jgi:peptide-methionine (S)-S-oxide reductase
VCFALKAQSQTSLGHRPRNSLNDNQAANGNKRAVARREQSHHDLPMQTEKATFGAGCFWGVEETFRNLKGVRSTAVGYAGGTKENPAYEDVCTDETGHAEVVEVEFDPSQISYDELLDVFWSTHNPTTLNRQGPDMGTQYRSVIFYHSPQQEAAAMASKERLAKSGRFDRPVVTQIEPAPKFWRAEEYHQRYLQKRGQAHCAI